MGQQVQTQTKAAPKSSSMSNQTGILQRKCACGQHTIAGEECEECRQKREGMMQRAAVSSAPVNAVPPIVHDVLNSSGQPLDADTRSFMEPRFGHDFSQVRVHTDERAAESARTVNALAYTVGRDVVFGTGQYAPGTSEGRRLLAHELAHVVQQGSRPIELDTKHTINIPGDTYEREADQFANLINSYATLFLNPRQTVISHPQSSSQQIPTLQRKAECSLKHIEDECNNASASCMTVQEQCKKLYPKPTDIDAAIKKGREQSKALAATAPNAAANMLHFLDNTGTEKVMPTDVFENNPKPKELLLKRREKFLEGAKRRLESGSLPLDVLSEQMVWMGTAQSFSYLHKTDLGVAVGGYTLCSKVRVKAKRMAANKFEISFVEWTVQAFDCYNWDPGKGIGVPGASDTEMCCIENAGKGKHFRIHTDEWKNSDTESTKPGEVVATLPSAPMAPTPSTLGK